MLRCKIALLLGLLSLSAIAGCTSDDPADDDGGEALERALAYSECMRDNGLKDFPDPAEQEGGGGGGLELPEGMDPESEEFQAAAEACEEFMPGADPEDEIDSELFAELLDYAECMRAEGIADFPDPESDGLNVHFEELGIDPDGEEYQTALEACEDERPDSGGLHDGA